MRLEQSVLDDIRAAALRGVVHAVDVLRLVDEVEHYLWLQGVDDSERAYQKFVDEVKAYRDQVMERSTRGPAPAIPPTAPERAYERLANHVPDPRPIITIDPKYELDADGRAVVNESKALPEHEWPKYRYNIDGTWSPVVDSDTPVIVKGE